MPSTTGTSPQPRLGWLLGGLLLVFSQGMWVDTMTPQQPMFTESEAYERFMGRWSRLLAPEFARFAGVQPRDRVLDVGCGTGALAFSLLATGEVARVTGIDPSAAYVAAAGRRGNDPRAQFEVGDAQAMRFAEGSFDRTLSLLVVNFIPDPGKALDEMVRVTRPGGVVAAAVWDYGEGMEMLRVFWDEAVARDPSIDGRDERHMRLCRKGELSALWRAHGLLDVAEGSLTIPLGFQSFDDYWAPFLLGQGPAGAYAASLPSEARDELRDRIRRRVIGDATDRAFTLKGRAWAVRGVVKAR